ncbi:MAG: septum site-determining protein MinD [Clostridia bacterium]|nr:septum site-determining protein MinD [Clostridia bacterium]
MSQAWVILSGKGGVGKSMVTSSLALALARRDMKCCCVDADMGLRSLDMLYNMHNKVVYDALDVARKDCKIKYALIPHTLHEGLSLLPASQLGDVSDMDADDMDRIVKKLKKRAGYVFLDAPAGIGRGVKNLLSAADHSILVTTADDIAIRDAERVIALLEESGKSRPMLIVNRVIPEMVLSGEMYSPQVVAATLDVPLLGCIPDDRAVLAAVNQHESFMERTCPAQAAIDRIAQRFLGDSIPMPVFEPQKRGLFRWKKPNGISLT